MKTYIKCLTTLVCLLSTTTFAQTSETTAPQSTPVTVRGDFRLRYDTSDGVDYTVSKANFPTRVAATYIRVRPEITWTVNPEFSLVLQPQAAKAFGEQGWIPSSATTNKKQDTSGSTNGDTMMTFHQAYGKWKPLSGFEFTAGREQLLYGDELVIGPSDWTNVSRTFDDIRIHATYAWGWTDAFTSKIEDTLATSGAPGDKDFYGIYNGWSFGPYVKALDIYVLELRDNSFQSVGAAKALPTQTVLATGVRAKSQIGPIDYRFEYTRETNSEVPSGDQGTLEVGYSLDMPIKPHFSLEYFYASADYNTLFTSAHKWLGYADIFGRRNIRGWGAHYSSGLVNAFSVAVDDYLFDRVDTTRSAYSTTQVALGSGTASTSSSLGNELDLAVKWQANKEVLLKAGYCVLFVGDYLKDQFSDDKPQYFYASIEARY